MFGFGGGNQFLDFFFLINLSVNSEFCGAPSTFGRPTLALGLTDFRCVPRCVRTVGQETCGGGCTHAHVRAGRELSCNVMLDQKKTV